MDRRRRKPAKRGGKVSGWSTRRAGGSTGFPAFGKTPKRSITFEKKFFDRTNIDAVISPTGTISNGLAGIPQGVDDSERVGRRVTITSLHWNYIVTLPKGALPDDAHDTVRSILILDRQANRGVPSVLDVLESANILSFRNLRNARRFRHLVDDTFTINSGSAVATETTATSLTKSHHKDLFETMYWDGATGLDSEILSINFFVLYISKRGRAGIESFFRFRYIDL